MVASVVVDGDDLPDCGVAIWQSADVDDRGDQGANS
jgi:hypothetical protein